MIIANPFPRFLDQVGIKGVPTGDQNLYIFALPVGICISGGVYWGLCVWSPVEGMGHVGTAFEGMFVQYDYHNANASSHETETIEAPEIKVRRLRELARLGISMNI
jgi:hypothetical protein